ncbi:HD domain-containing protein [Clostridium nigeriense]|uniref:HD domain-containing protein n=1 Tax=Clostridium nigeriense TaxID=1805470 RepID=UPI003D358725
MDTFNKINKILLDSENPSIEIEKLMKEEYYNNSIFEILTKLKDIPQDKKFHPEGNVWNHTKMVIDFAAKVRNYSNNKEMFMWSALFHDIGKITTTKFIKGRYRSYNHDTEGEKISYNLLKEYISDKEAINISETIKFHMHHIYILKDLPFSDISNLTKSNNYNDIILLFICDKLGRGKQNKEDKIRVLNEVKVILDKLERENSNINNDIKLKIEEIKNIIIK